MLKIAIIGGKGGTTKTSTARAVATRAVLRGFSTAGFDTDGEQASFIRWNERRKQLGTVAGFPVVSSENIGQMLASLDKLNYQVGVIDGGAYVSRDSVAIAQRVDAVVIPTTDSMDDMESTVRIVEKLKAKGIPAMRIIVTLCGVLESVSSLRDAQDYLESLGIYVVPGYIPRKTSFKNAQDAGFALVEVQNAPRLYTMARQVIDGILDRAIFVKEVSS